MKFAVDNGDGFLDDFDALDQAVKGAEYSIAEFRSDPEGWPEEVNNVRVLVVTHAAQEVNLRERPPADQLDSEGYDDDGICWRDFDRICDYRLQETDAGRLLRLGPAVIEAARDFVKGKRRYANFARLINALAILDDSRE